MPSDLPPSDSDTCPPSPAAWHAAALSASLIRQNNAPLARCRTSSASNSVVSPCPPPPGLSCVSASTTGRDAPRAMRFASATASAAGSVSCTKSLSRAATCAANASAAASAFAWRVGERRNRRAAIGENPRRESRSRTPVRRRPSVRRATRAPASPPASAPSACTGCRAESRIPAAGTRAPMARRARCAAAAAASPARRPPSCRHADRCGTAPTASASRTICAVRLQCGSRLMVSGRSPTMARTRRSSSPSASGKLSTTAAPCRSR